jgi:membrane-associated protease RseP (regulator of RpoE activity)
MPRRALIYVPDVSVHVFPRGINRGAIVQDVTPGSPADRIGLRPYDVILSFDGKEVVSDDDLIRTIAARAPGSAVDFQVLRDGRRVATTHEVLAELILRDSGIQSDLLSQQVAGDLSSLREVANPRSQDLETVT